MSITVVTRPEKTLSNGFLSTWNSSELPLRFKFENDLFPINKVDLIESIQSVNYAPDKQGTAITFSFPPVIIWSVNDFVKITNTDTDLDDGYYKIKEFDGNFDMILDVYTEETSNTGNCQKYYRNYTGLVKVFAGARDGHPYNIDGSKPLKEIGVIEVDFKEENGDNIGYANVKSFVKPDITADFDYDYENSHFGWSSFHIQTAESYDAVPFGGGDIVNITTDFIDDEQEDCDIFADFLNPSFDDGLDDWSQDCVSTFGCGSWVAGVGNVTYNDTLQSPILHQEKRLYKDVPYELSLNFDAVIGNDIVILIYVYDGVSWANINADTSFPSIGNHVRNYTITSPFDVDKIGVVFTSNQPTINTINIQLNSLNISTNVSQPCLYFNYAVYGCKQFQDELGGNFGDYVLNKVDTITPKILTHFDELSYFYGKPFYLNGIIPSSLFSQSQGGDNLFLSIEVFDESDNSLLSYNYKVDNYGDGVYTVDPDLKTQLDINNIGDCDWKYANAQFIILPANLFVDGDKGTFENNANGFTLLNNGGTFLGEIGSFFNQDGSKARTGANSAFFRTNAPNQLITPVTKGIFPIFKNNTLLSVTQGLEYEISGYIAMSLGIPGTFPHINNGFMFFLPSGYEYEECDISGFLISEQNSYTDLSPSFNQWLKITTKFTAKATEELTFTLCEKITNNISSTSGFGANIDDITFKGPIEYISENKNVKNQCSCSPYGVTLRWKNDLGGWESWYFDKKAIYSENVTNKINITRDITSNWDDTFINSDTQNDTIKTTSNKSILVRSQLLTKNEQEVLQQIRRSTRVQLLMDSGKWQTVTIKQGKFIINEEGDKTRDISFEINLPNTIIQDQ
tara:strand:+ start:895 stop:3453 length:2559 start_codon:yes stop_codon:yes gene_type:complete